MPLAAPVTRATLLLGVSGVMAASLHGLGIDMGRQKHQQARGRAGNGAPVQCRLHPVRPLRQRPGHAEACRDCAHLAHGVDEGAGRGTDVAGKALANQRSEEHTSELQSHSDLVCRLLLEKKKETTFYPESLRSKEQSPSSECSSHTFLAL